MTCSKIVIDLDIYPDLATDRSLHNIYFVHYATYNYGVWRWIYI